MASRLLLLRHPSVRAEFAGRLNGRADVPLADGSETELRAALTALQAEQCNIIVSSPLRRSSQSARTLAGWLQTPVELDDDLAEADFGAWDGKLYSEVESADPENARRFRQWDPTFSFPGGESIQAFFSRVIGVTQRLCDRKEETILVVSHGGVIRQMICHLLGLSPRQYLLFDVQCGKVAALNVFGYRAVLVGLNLG